MLANFVKLKFKFVTLKLYFRFFFLVMHAQSVYDNFNQLLYM